MTETTPGGKIIVPLVVLAAVIAVAWVWMGKPNTSSVPDLTEAAISSAAVAPAAGTETPAAAVAHEAEVVKDEAAESGAAPVDAVVGAPADAPVATESQVSPPAPVEALKDTMPAAPAETPAAAPATTP